METASHIQDRLAQRPQITRSDRQNFIAPTARRQAFEFQIAAELLLRFVTDAVEIQQTVWFHGAGRFRHTFRHIDDLPVIEVVKLLRIVPVNAFRRHGVRAFFSKARPRMHAV